MNKLRLVLAIGGFVAAFLMADGVDARQAPVDGECQAWAENLDQAFVRDSFLMHTIGCDEGRLTEGVYVRTDGVCNEAARRGFRHGLEAGTQALENYVESFGCRMLDDGTYVLNGQEAGT